MRKGTTFELGEKLTQPPNLKGFVSGHDFSHANKANQMIWALERF
jgi:hypothetical protein